MNKSLLICSVLLFLGIKMNAQELTCADFKIGTFSIPATKGWYNYTVIEKDSVYNFTPEIDKSVKQFIVVRKKNSQIEWKNNVGNGDPLYEIIEWIDDCSYRLTYDSTKVQLDDYKKWINQNNGIVVTTTKIENKILYALK